MSLVVIGRVDRNSTKGLDFGRGTNPALGHEIDR
jgi:hypothetical protein